MPSYLEQQKRAIQESTFQSSNFSSNAYQANVSSSTNFSSSSPQANISVSQQAAAVSRATNLFAPQVTGIDKSVEIGESIGARSFFKTSDLDGNKITRFRFYDSGQSARSGGLYLQGRQQKARQWFEVGVSGLSKLRYKAGIVRGSEAINIRVYDGLFWSNLGKAQITSIPENTGRPVVSTTNATVIAYENIQAGGLFSAIDPEGKDIVKYAVRDTNRRDPGGHFTVNGSKRTEGTFFPVRPDTLNSLRYFGRRSKKSSTEVVEVRAFDGKLWSSISRLNIKTIGNRRAPKVVISKLNLGLNQTIDAVDLFRVSDADGNTIKKYRIEDTGVLSDGGYFTFKGRKQKARKRFEVLANELGELSYTTAATADFERLRVQAFDGRYWSKVKSAEVTTIELPIVKVTDPVQVLDEVFKVRVKDIIEQGDTGPRPVYYEVYDASGRSSSAYYELGSRDLPANVVHRVSASKIASLKVQAAKSDTGRDFDEFYIRANNGQYTGAWSRFQVSTESIGPRALASSAAWHDSPNPQRVTITYSFALRTPLYYLYEPNGLEPVAPNDEWENRGTFSTLNANMRDGVRYALDTWAAVTGITFEEVSDTTIDGGLTGGAMRFGSYDMPDADVLGYAYFPDKSGLSGDNFRGDVWFNTDFFPYNFTGAAGTYDMSLGDEGILTAIHEIGHAIGLSHSFNEQDGDVFLHPEQENQRHTVMSYTRNADVANNLAGPITPLIYDIMRAQQVYGEERKINHTDTVWSYEANDNFVKALWDPGGHDLLDFSNYTQNGTIDLREGTFSSVGGRQDNFFMAYGTRIEDVTGGRGNESITGNEYRNVLRGEVGNDTITGGGGRDFMYGGAGNDTYIYKQADGYDVIDEEKRSGRDTLEIWGFDGINKLDEDLTFRRFGNTLRIDLTVDGTTTQGTVIIRDQGLGASKVETLRLRRINGSQIGRDIDLDSIFTNATNVPTQFKITRFTSGFGNLATPV